MNEEEREKARLKLKRDLVPVETKGEQQELEQGMAWLLDTLPGNWWRLFSNCRNQGFDDLQSFELLKTYIISQGSGDKKAP